MNWKAFWKGFYQGWLLPFLALKAFAAVFRRTWHGEYEEAVLEVNMLWQTQPEIARKRLDEIRRIKEQFSRDWQAVQ